MKTFAKKIVTLDNRAWIQALLFGFLLIAGAGYAFAGCKITYDVDTRVTTHHGNCPQDIPSGTIGRPNTLYGQQGGGQIQQPVMPGGNAGNVNLGNLSTGQVVGGVIGFIDAIANKRDPAVGALEVVAAGAIGGVVGDKISESKSQTTQLAQAPQVAAQQGASRGGSCSILKKGVEVKKVRASSLEDCDEKQKKFEEEDSK